MSDVEVVDAMERLAYFAVTEGFDLGTVFIEEVHTSPAAFEALIAAVDRYEVTAVVLPSMLHFAVLGAPVSIKTHFEHLTGARVLVANIPSPRSEHPSA